jgi:hypothetical protein
MLHTERAWHSLLIQTLDNSTYDRLTFSENHDGGSIIDPDDFRTSTRTLFARLPKFDADRRLWIPFLPERVFETCVIPPGSASCLGYDVVTCSMQNSPECSPLSCNGLATDIQANENCLIDSLDYAKECLEDGMFDNSEPKPFRLIEVNAPNSESSASLVR